MIVRMKKLVVFCHQADRGDTVEALQNLGVLHVTPTARPAGENLDETREQLRAVERALSELPPAKAVKQKTEDETYIREQAADSVLKILALATKKSGLTDQLQDLENECARIEPLGNFDPAEIHELRERGIAVEIICDTARAPVTAADGTALTKLVETPQARYWLAAGRDSIEVSGGTVFALPERSYGELQHHAGLLQQQISDMRDDLRRQSAHRPLILQWQELLRDDLQYLEAHAGMGLHGDRVAYIQGFCPENEVSRLEDAAAQQGWGIWFEAPSEEDEVPTLIKNPEWIKPIKGVFDVIGIFPGYREIDISSVFLVFFSIFFAMIIGDGGYGLLFLGLTALARSKFPSAPAYPFTLLKLLSICTIVWGVLTGNFFGIRDLPGTLEKMQVPGVDGGIGCAIILAVMLIRKRTAAISERFARRIYGFGILLIAWGSLTGNLFGLSVVPGFLDTARSEWLGDQANMQKLCFLLGSIHLTIAHAWNALTIINSTKAIAQVGWILITWAMYAMACAMILFETPPTWFIPSLVLGFIFVLLFMNTRAELKKELHTYFVLPLDIIGNFVDIVSYIRLFAVGLASYSIAVSFNDMALARGFGGPVAALISAFILFAGHGLNILLCVMGVLVHGVRLNTLEFSRHIGIQWSGHAFSPLRRTAAISETSPERSKT